MGLVDWAGRLGTPAGIGVDMVDIAELQALDARTKGAFAQRTFTRREQEEAEGSPDKWGYLAGRFAVKEAVFKALAPLIPGKAFDFRIVETLRQADGSPAVIHGGALGEVLCAAGVDRLLVSISNESGFAVAFVVGVSGRGGG